MILVFSIFDDPSTNDIVDWLTFYGEKAIRLNTSSDVENFFKNNTNVYLSTNSDITTDGIIKSVWFRRSPTCTTQPIFSNIETDKIASRFFVSEHTAAVDIISTVLKDKKWLNDRRYSRPRKLDQLILAKQAGLTIPNSAIIGNKQELARFCKDNGQVILKPIQDPYPISIKHKMYLQYTAVVTSELFDILMDTFYPCLFQQCIDKNLEIRTFFLDGKCYSMAICSSFDKQTQIDFRRYNGKKPNRQIPFQLPTDIENKIKIFMNSLQLNCGSLDLILDNTGKYYFLEVNPVGQFGMVSFPCNYNLEKKIADFLINKS